MATNLKPLSNRTGPDAPRRLPEESLRRSVGIAMIIYWVMVPIALLYGLSQATPFLDAHLPSVLKYLGEVTPALQRRAIRLLFTFVVLITLCGLELLKLLSRRFAPSWGLDLAIEENDRRHPVGP